MKLPVLHFWGQLALQQPSLQQVKEKVKEKEREREREREREEEKDFANYLYDDISMALELNCRAKQFWSALKSPTGKSKPLWESHI